MIVLDQPIFAGDVPADIPSGGRRFYRSRNLLVAGHPQWSTSPDIPADTPAWDDMLGNSIRAGIKAARQTIKPAIVVWGVMACLATLYYAVPASRAGFAAMTSLQERLGPLFPFLGMGLSVGLLAEAVKVGMSREKRWTRENSINAVFNLVIFGILGVLQNHLYAFQARIFGTGTSLQVMVPKVLFDQFVWTVLFANPYQTILYLWRNRGFSARKVTEQMFPFKAFWGTQVLPVLVANWFFWIPMVSIIYSFPDELQLPLAILAVTIWVLLLSVLTSESHEER